MPMIEILWFADCPNTAPARALLAEVVAEVAPGTAIEEIDASDQAVAKAHRFAGSPTIRVDGRDIDPGYADDGDYTPRCRVFQTAAGLQGVPPRAWIEDALRAATAGHVRDQLLPSADGEGAETESEVA